MATLLDPPPTINNLDRHQRMRLVRSNRKLEAVLGTAPYYLEPEATPKASRREGRIFGHSHSSSSLASASTTSLNSVEDLWASGRSSPIRKQAPLELSRPLLLRLRSVPVSPLDSRAARLTPRLPSITPVSPLSPTFTIDLESLQATSQEKRRKKMAKLQRTLGENIPPELVFRSPKSASAVEKPVVTRSLERKRLPSPFTHPAPQTSDDSAKPPLVISRPKRSRPRVPPPPSAPAPTVPVLHITASREPSKAGTTIAERRRKPRPRSLSLSTGTDMLIAAAQEHSKSKNVTRTEDVLVGKIIAPLVRTEVFTVRASLDVYSPPQYTGIDEKATKDLFESRSPLPFQTTIPAAHTPQHQHSRSSPTNNPDSRYGPIETVPLSAQHHSKSKSTSASPQCMSAGAPSAFRHGRRKEVGWSGEWNHDMGAVVKNLRNLKAR